MKKTLRVLCAFIACFTLSLGSVVHAQAPEPPVNPGVFDDKNDEGPLGNRPRNPLADELIIASSDDPNTSDNEIQATSDPDGYGYTWNDSVPFTWTDISGGVTVGTPGYTGYSTSYYGPYSLPFNFNFYENTYSQVYISQSGFLIFETQGGVPNDIPSITAPNNLVAPYTHENFYYDSESWLKYSWGGTQPNRYLVVEWHNLRGGPASDPIGGNEVFRFQAILHESGNIAFKYHTMTYSGDYVCGGSSGIENSNGTDGLKYLPTNCTKAPSSKAVLFSRPGPSAGIMVFPNQFGALAGTRKNVEIKVPIYNNGEAGNDVYDLDLVSDWASGLYNANGTALLTDTDGDGQIDTGVVPQGEEVKITAKFITPDSAVIGDDQTALLTVTSSLNNSVSTVVPLKTAIPAPFVQLFRDTSQWEMKLGLYQSAKNAEIDFIRQEWPSPSAVVESPNGNFIYAWDEDCCLDNVCDYIGSEVNFAILDRAGRTVLPATRLAVNYGATTNVYDLEPSIAVAPNGNIAVLWQRSIEGTATVNNMYYAVLNSNGGIIKSPTSITNETGSTDTSFVTYGVAATSDNRFHFTWEKLTRVFTGGVLTQSVRDVYFMAVANNGDTLLSATKMTSDTTALDDGFLDAMIEPLQSSRTMLLWSNGSNEDIYYTILNSSGSVYKGTTNLSGDGNTLEDRYPTAVQLHNGNTFITWKANPTMRFATLDSTFQLISGPTALNPSGASFDGPPSVTSDTDNRAIITWSDWNSPVHLFYSLVDGSNGTVLTQPMVFQSADAGDLINDGYVQSGNSSFSWIPWPDTDAWVLADTYFTPTGTTVETSVRFGNIGFTPTSSTVLTATLAPGLSLAGATIPPNSHVGNVYTWNLADLDWLDSGNLNIWTGYTDAIAGNVYTIEWNITSAGTEANPVDNTAISQFLVPSLVFLPLIRR